MLKKIAMFIALSALLSGLASAAYVDLGTAMTAAGVSYKPSNNVEMQYLNDGLTAPQAYNIASKNTSGDTVYATSSMSGNIYRWKTTSASPAGKKLSECTGVTLPATAGESTGWTSDWEGI